MKYLRTLPVILSCFMAAASVQAVEEVGEDVNNKYIQARSLIQSEDNGEQEEGIRILKTLALRESPYIPAVNLLFKRLSQDCPVARQVLEEIVRRDIEAREEKVKEKWENHLEEDRAPAFGRVVLAIEQAYKQSPVRYSQYKARLDELLVTANEAREILRSRPGLGKNFVAHKIGWELLGDSMKLTARSLFEDIETNDPLWEDKHYSHIMYHYAHSLLLGFSSEGGGHLKGVQRAFEIIRAGIEANAPNTKSLERLLFCYEKGNIMYSLTLQRVVRSPYLRTKVFACVRLAQLHAPDRLEEVRQKYIEEEALGSPGKIEEEPEESDNLTGASSSGGGSSL